MENLAQFLKCNECTKILEKEDKFENKKGLALFKNLDDTEVKLHYISVADSAYDQTFKTLFTGDMNINGINSKLRLMSLLNSLLFPDAGECDFKIRKIEYLPNESVNFNKTYNVGVISFDVPCICFCNKNNNEKNNFEFCVDLEMQIKYETTFIYRFNKHKDSFRSFHQKPVVVLTFLNFKNGTDPFNKVVEKYNNENVRGIASFLIDDKNNPLEIMHESFSNTYFFNLKNEINDINNRKPIRLNNKELGPTGLAWIKLLSLRHWATIDETFGNGRFIIPGDLYDLPIEIQSAITILQFVDNDNLKLYINNEKEALDRYEDIKEDGRNEGRKEKEMKMKKDLVSKTMKMIKNNVSIDFIKEYSILSEDEVQIIADFINKPDYQISDLELNLNFEKNDLVEICKEYNLDGEERKIKKQKI